MRSSWRRRFHMLRARAITATTPMTITIWSAPRFTLRGYAITPGETRHSTPDPSAAPHRPTGRDAALSGNAGPVTGEVSWAAAATERRTAAAPHAAATKQAAAPTTNPARAPNISHTQPNSGPPIGVLPSSTIACSASTRPRITGAVLSCTIDVVVVMTTMLAKPRNNDAATVVASVGETAITSMLTPNSTAPRTTSRWEMPVRLADTRAAASEPIATTEYRIVKVVSVPPRFSLTNSGKTTGKFIANVPMIVVITSGTNRSTSERT